jgi:hypothetical protein
VVEENSHVHVLLARSPWVALDLQRASQRMQHMMRTRNCFTQPPYNFGYQYSQQLWGLHLDEESVRLEIVPGCHPEHLFYLLDVLLVSVSIGREET